VTDNSDLDDLGVGPHVPYTFRLDGGVELTHGAIIKEIPPWTDPSGEDHDHILLRRSDERVVRVSLSDVELEPQARQSDDD
jgi:hypothetical protein